MPKLTGPFATTLAKSAPYGERDVSSEVGVRQRKWRIARFRQQIRLYNRPCGRSVASFRAGVLGYPQARVYVSHVSTMGHGCILTSVLTSVGSRVALASAQRSEQRCHDDPSCGRADTCGAEAKLGALEPGTGDGPPADPLWFFSRLRRRRAWGSAGMPALRLSPRGIAAFRLGHRRRHLVRGGRPIRAGGGSICGLLRLLLHRAPLL